MSKSSKEDGGDRRKEGWRTKARISNEALMVEMIVEG